VRCVALEALYCIEVCPCQVDAAVACCVAWRRNSTSVCFSCTVLQGDRCSYCMEPGAYRVPARRGGAGAFAVGSRQVIVTLLCTFKMQICNSSGMGA
jgi:hypothetical protein